MRKYLRHLLRLLLGAFVLSVSACGPYDEEQEDARLRVTLTDAPADYDEVWIDLQGMNVRVGDRDIDFSDEDIFDDGPILVNLLDLTGGNTLPLVDEDLPSGSMSEIRLLLGENNSVVVDGVTYPLKTPSAQQSGLKVKINQDLQPGITYELLLDFDAARSIVQQGSGDYLLKPVIRASFVAVSGAIEGSVNTSANVYALSGADTLATTTTNSAGAYKLWGIPAGTYTLSFEPSSSSYLSKQVPEVTVTTGNTTVLEPVVLEMAEGDK